MNIDPKKIKIIYGREDSIDYAGIEQDGKELEMALNAKKRMDEIKYERQKKLDEIEYARRKNEL